MTVDSARILRLDRILALVWRASPDWSLISAFAIVFEGLLPIALLYVVKLIVDLIASGIVGQTNEVARSEIVFIVALAAGVAVLQILAAALGRLASEVHGQEVTDYMYGLLHRKAVKVDLEYFDRAELRDRLYRAQREAPFRPTRIVNGLIAVGQHAVTLFAMAALLFTFHWLIVPLLLAVSMPGVFVRLMLARKMYSWQQEKTPEERRAAYFSRVLTTDQFASDVRLFDLGGIFTRRFQDVRRQLRRERFRLILQRQSAEFATEGIATVTVFGVLGFISVQAIDGAITIGDVVMYFTAIQRARESLGQILRSISGLYEDNMFFNDVHSFLEEEPKIRSAPSAKHVANPITKGMKFEHVYFRYPDKQQDALSDINFRIETGDHLAIVGPNGSGKTTLLKLLTRMYDPSAGRIYIDDIDLRNLVITDLRRNVAVLSQDFGRYQQSACENIWFGDKNTPIDSPEIEACARQAGIHDRISQLPQGYETMLGTWFTGSHELSVGEWQKLALARTLFRDAQIIALDEPTSALDAWAERTSMGRFNELSGGRTTIIVRHRLSTIRFANRILVLDRGRIVDEGTHDGLVRRCPVYRQLFAAELFETQQPSMGGE